MIHSAAAVQTENFEAPPTVPEPFREPIRRRFPLPAEYYSTAPGDRRPLVPEWVPLGCGGVSVALLVVVFTAGYFAAHGGAVSLLQWLISQSRSDITRLFTKDVTAAQKQTFDAEMTKLEKNVTSKRVGIQSMQPFLRDMRDFMLDQKVTADETQKLITDLETVNRPTKPK